ncbi:MAG: hypothetical protein AB1345_10280 [Chloroflexota bacterium]
MSLGFLYQKGMLLGRLEKQKVEEVFGWVKVDLRRIKRNSNY